MIKINLLPKSIYAKKAVRNTAIVFGILLVAIIAGCLTLTIVKRGQVEYIREQADLAEQWKSSVDQLIAYAKGVRESIGPINQKLAFINDVLEYNEQFPKLYEEVAKWTYEKVSYTSMQCNGASVQMQARVKSLDDLGRYLLNMYQATDLFTSVTISGIPGYPRQQGGGLGEMPQIGSGEEGLQPSLAGLEAIVTGVTRRPDDDWIVFTVDCALRTPINAPQPAGAVSGGQPGQMGMPGAPSGMPGPQMSPGQQMPMGPRGPMGGS